jgi:2-C-methyl-D-erythritol 4-phosphate cytidylyltransferase
LGDRRNIKITTPEDLAIAEALWKSAALPKPVDSAGPNA